jgi:hypothetical protein
LIQTFGPAKVWSPAGASPGAVQRSGEAKAKRAEQNNDRNPEQADSKPNPDTLATVTPLRDNRP